MKVVHINESKLRMLVESNEYLSFDEFFEETKKFLEGILKDPIGTEPSEVLKSHGLTNGKFRNILCNKNLLSKKERIDEPYDEETKEKTSRYYATYTLKELETVKDKLRKLYDELFK